MKLQRVVAAVDLSSAPEALNATANVLTAAAELASRFGADVVIVHALDPTGLALTDEGDDERAPEVRARIALVNGAEALSRAFPALAVRTSLEHAATNWLAILSAAERLDADIVVLGGGRHVRDGVLGSTATMVTNISRRSVLVVRGAQGLAPRTNVLSTRRSK